MYRRCSFSLLVLFLFISPSFAQNPAPAAAQKQAIIVENAVIHIGNGQVIENGAIRFENGLITEIGTVNNRNEAEIINAEGKHLYPGLILPSSIIGLSEVSAIRATNDFEEVGDFKPHIRSLVAFNTDSEIIPTLRSNGILIAQSTPRGGTIAGTSSIMEMDGWNWEDAVLKADDGIHLNWISTRSDKRVELAAKLQQFFQEAYSYSISGKPETVNLKFEAMKGLFSGEKTLFVSAKIAKEIIEAINFAKGFPIPKIVLVGAHESYKVIDFLKQQNIPILLNRVHSLPFLPEEDVFMPYKLASILSKEGLVVGLMYDDEEPMGSRNLPFLAGTCAAYGLSKEEALQLVTQNTAKILGIEDKVGTLEVGKHATMVLSKGDILDMRTNEIEKAFIRGKKIDLDTKHKRLFKIYKDKYDNQK